MPTITVHTIVKNEENFIWYAVKSVIDYVDKIIVFDTGSRDNTVRIIQDLVKEYPLKIIFDEKGTCDKKRHTQLRQEMLALTSTDWFMILDGDEVWTDKGMKEVLHIISENSLVECVVAPFHLCVGDVFHETIRNGGFDVLGRRGHHSPRVFKICNGIKWGGDYELDLLYNSKNEVFYNKENTYFLINKYWHLTHLPRSSKDQDDYSSGGTRREKTRNTYLFIGRKINEEVPKVFCDFFHKLNFISSLLNFIMLIRRKL